MTNELDNQEIIIRTVGKDLYATSIQHLLAELKRIDVLIIAEIEINRRQNNPDVNLIKMYGVSEDEIDALIKDSIETLSVDVVKPSRLNDRTAQILEKQKDDIADRKSESIARNVHLRLERLREMFHLSPDEIDILLISLAPEINNKYQRFFAYLQDDRNQIRPSVDLILRLLNTVTRFDSVGKLEKYGLFADKAPLVKRGLVYLQEDTSRPGQPLLNRLVTTDERIRDYLLGSDYMAREIDSCASCHVPQKKLDDLLIKDEFKAHLLSLIRSTDFKQGTLILYFQGEYGTGKQAVAEGLCAARGLKLITVDLKSLVRLKPAEFSIKFSELTREAELQTAALLINDFDLLIPRRQDVKNEHKDSELTQDGSLLNSLVNMVTKGRGLVFFTGTVVWEPTDLPRESSFFRVLMPYPDTLEREQLWKLWQQEYPPFADDVDLLAISNRFRFSPGQIRDTLDTAASLSRWRDPQNTTIENQDLSQACRLQSNRRLASLAQNIRPHYLWDDLILAPGTEAILEEIKARVTHSALVYEQWGFDRKLAMGKGLQLLFSGPPGTGKTMAADVLANEFEMSLYKIDLSTVVSKYIGETEKNLSEIFHEGETSNAILFFDEADALFGKRSEVKDAHDRHANIEVGYLLQRMEQYSGIVILATNFRRNMDDAFTRRLHYCVDFPLPGKPERLRIWQKIWPKDTPRSPALDLDFLAERLEISGGYIRNIALAAAFMAAEEASDKEREPEVSMTHLIHAARREYQKMGQILKQTTLSKQT